MRNAPDRVTRRRFLGMAATGVAAAASVGPQLLLGCREMTGVGDEGRALLPAPRTLPAGDAPLTPAPGLARATPETATAVWQFNGSLPGPTIRGQRDDQARIRLVNRLPEPTLVHWHGLMVPAEADGHPRDAIAPGAVYDYAFPIAQRAGTFWYHPHPHHLTAAQVHRGLAGFFLVSDEQEAALGLPGGDHEILLLLQDRDEDVASAFEYAPAGDDLHTGMLRDVPYGNGVRRPGVDVIGTRYRLRVLNASNARVYRLGLEDGTPIRVIGNDGGLLASAADVESVYLGVGERIDFLVECASMSVGRSVMLRSLPFTVPGTPGGSTQGRAMDLLELRRIPGTGPADPPLPATLSSVAPLGPPAGERRFVFSSSAQEGMHRINGRSFDMERIDERIALGRVERWVFQNDSALPHPVHLHGTQFQVEARSGGRATVYPYEGGWKDTVLVMPLETVAVRVRYELHRGLFMLHCHNLQHEDGGMMLNVEVV